MGDSTGISICTMYKGIHGEKKRHSKRVKGKPSRKGAAP